MSLSYKKAWKLLEHATPVKTDCGALCHAACCKGGSGDGMLLYPGEERMYAKGGDWFRISDSQITLSDGTPVKLFVCTGSCDRTRRPLACRIFPILPHLDGSDYLDFVPDLRGAMICPLLSDAVQPVSPEFIDALYAAFDCLADDERVLEFIQLLSDQNDAMADLYKKLL